jgi:RNA recognition motif-containing protein
VSGELRGFGYAKFASLVDVLTAIRLLNGYELQGSNLLVKIELFTFSQPNPYSKAPQNYLLHLAQSWRENSIFTRNL